jgi:Transglycosylase SLT domain
LLTLLGGLLLVLAPAPASATQVKVPLEIDYITLAAALKRQVYNGPDGRAVLWTGSDKCQHLYAYDPQFAPKNGALSLDTRAELSLGLAVGGKCVTPITWTGVIEVDTPPYISQLTIKFHVTNINLYNPQYEKSLLVGHGFDLIKDNFIPKIRTFTYDLNAPLQDLEGLVRAGSTPDVAQRVGTALSTLKPMSAVVPGDNGLKVALEMTVPEVASPAASASPTSAPLTAAEIAAWQNVLDNWDAFVVFAIKQLGNATTDAQVRAQLFDLLLDSRYRLVDALSRPQASTGPDPVRLIFLDVWSRLHTIIRSAAQRGMLGDRAIEFLSFVTAGDALFAFDQAAPALGMRVSTDDLRRLAHMMAPQYTSDPLAFSYDTDPALRQMFGVTQPLESLGPLEPPPADEEPPSASPSPTSATMASPPSVASPTSGASSTPGASVAPSASTAASPPQNRAPSPAPTPIATPSATPAGQSPSSSGSPPPASSPGPTSMLQIPFELLAPAEAEASDHSLADQIFAFGAALKRVVVDENNVTAYVHSVQGLLTLTAQREGDEGGLEQQYRHNYLLIVKTTAWQESCWRQYIRVNGHVRFVESATGDVGIMQVNKHVWRGFYSVPRLEWDIVYNTGAGSEILMRLMRGARTRSRDKGASQPDPEVARSTYAAYNGGPDAYDRWRHAHEPAELKMIDDSFWTKYRAMTASQSFDILHCRTQCGPNCN